MSEATVLLKEYTPAEGNKPHKFKDGNDTEYTTFKDAIANPAKELLGKQVVIHYSEKQNGNYTNRYLDSIEAVPSGNGDHPPLGTGEYVKGQLAPTDAQRILLCNSWERGVELAGILAARADEQVFDQARLFQLAEKFAKDVWASQLRSAGLMTDDLIPF